MPEMSAEEHEEMIKQRVKDAFKQWDVNQDGIISKHEMKTILLRLLNKQSNVSEDDVDAFMKDADKNQDGVIQYDEFLDWILRPGAKMTAGAAGNIKAFDLESVLQPLYNVYDKNKDGQVSWDEFEECYCILANSLQLSKAGGNGTKQPVPAAAWMKDVDQAGGLFNKIDTDHDRWVSFKEFCEWQREALANSGLHSDDLTELIPNLARQLNRVYKMSEADPSEVQEQDQRVLQRIIDSIANVTRDLWNTEKAGISRMKDNLNYTNRWTEPPIGLNITRLKGMHMKLVPGMMLGVSKLDLEIFCIPQVPTDVEAPLEQEYRTWIARIVQIVTLRSGKVQKEPPSFYTFSDMQWRDSEDASEMASLFNTSLEAMSPPLRVFCQLKTEANFGIKITWDQILVGLQSSVASGWMTQEQFSTYKQHMESVIAQMLVAERRESHDDDGVAPVDDASVRKKLQQLVQIPPRSVMAKLSELGIFEVSPVWADFME